MAHLIFNLGRFTNIVPYVRFQHVIEMADTGSIFCVMWDLIEVHVTLDCYHGSECWRIPPPT